MAKPTPWTCPYCNHKVLITSDNTSQELHHIYIPSKHGNLIFGSNAITCPNEDCKEITLMAGLYKSIYNPQGTNRMGDTIRFWNLLPEASIKVFPTYIPEPLLADYREACLVLDKSPKASATLARRCLQGMIRDFWKISKSRLKDEVDALQEVVDPATWSAIDAIRQIGNIGAHMEKDINLIIEVSEDEAQLLINLIETLFNDWYVVKHDREERLKKIVSISKEKSDRKKENK